MKYLSPVDDNNVICPTFGNDKRNCFTTIDYIFFTDELSAFVTLYKVIDNHCNFSDHSPVHLLLSIPISHALGSALFTSLSGQRHTIGLLFKLIVLLINLNRSSKINLDLTMAIYLHIMNVLDNCYNRLPMNSSVLCHVTLMNATPLIIVLIRVLNIKKNV